MRAAYEHGYNVITLTDCCAATSQVRAFLITLLLAAAPPPAAADTPAAALPHVVAAILTRAGGARRGSQVHVPNVQQAHDARPIPAAAGRVTHGFVRQYEGGMLLDEVQDGAVFR